MSDNSKYGINSSWGKNNIMRDSIHGYINIPAPIVKGLIDTQLFQRLKNIEQTGMKVLYPSATHDRFTHSLGVYYLGTKAFQNFRKNVHAQSKDEYMAVVSQVSYKTKLIQANNVWDRWGLLFSIACLLHDCGHAPFSHTLEFLYDVDRESQMKDDIKTIKVNRLLCAELVCLEDSEKRIRSFTDDFYYSDNDGEKCKGKPHERMSAYLS